MSWQIFFSLNSLNENIIFIFRNEANYYSFSNPFSFLTKVRNIQVFELDIYIYMNVPGTVCDGIPNCPVKFAHFRFNLH